MKIKTIYRQLTNSGEFDQLVNEAAEQGWRLTKREMLPGCPLTPSRYRPCLLYAELVLPDPPAEPVEPDVFDCAEAIHRECDKHESCTECPLEDVCSCYPPNRWKA